MIWTIPKARNQPQFFPMPVTSAINETAARFCALAVMNESPGKSHSCSWCDPGAAHALAGRPEGSAVLAGLEHDLADVPAAVDQLKGAVGLVQREGLMD